MFRDQWADSGCGNSVCGRPTPCTKLSVVCITDFRRLPQAFLHGSVHGLQDMELNRETAVLLYEFLNWTSDRDYRPAQSALMSIKFAAGVSLLKPNGIRQFVIDLPERGIQISVFLPWKTED